MCVQRRTGLDDNREGGVSEGVYSVGLDMGGTKCAAVLLAPDGRVIERDKVPTPQGAGAVVDALVGVAEGLMAKSPAPVRAVGCGVPGLMTTAGVLRFAPHLPGVTELPLADILRRRLGVHVIVDNDNTCATWGEYEIARAGDPFLYVGFGTGIGGGFVIDGKLARGSVGFAGEIGHIVVQADGPECICGRRGCWEIYASGNGLGRLAEEAGLEADGRGVRSLLRTGDPKAVQVVETFASWVALGLTNLAFVLDPAVIVLGGGAIGLPEEAGELISPIWRHLSIQFGNSAGHRPLPDLRGARLGPEAGAIGAARMATREVLDGA